MTRHAAGAAGIQKDFPLFFGREGCGWCEKTNKEAFSDPQLRRKYISHYVLVYVDAESGRRLTLPNGERITEVAVVWDDDRDGTLDIWLSWPTEKGWSEDYALPGGSDPPRSKKARLLRMTARVICTSFGLNRTVWAGPRGSDIRWEGGPKSDDLSP